MKLDVDVDVDKNIEPRNKVIGAAQQAGKAIPDSVTRGQASKIIRAKSEADTSYNASDLEGRIKTQIDEFKLELEHKQLMKELDEAIANNTPFRGIDPSTLCRVEYR